MLFERHGIPQGSGVSTDTEYVHHIPPPTSLRLFQQRVPIIYFFLLDSVRNTTAAFGRRLSGVEIKRTLFHRFSTADYCRRFRFRQPHTETN